MRWNRANLLQLSQWEPSQIIWQPARAQASQDQLNLLAEYPGPPAMKAQCYMPQRACDNPSVSDRSARHIHVAPIRGLFETSLLSSCPDTKHHNLKTKNILEYPTATGSVERLVLFGGRKLNFIILD